MPQRYNILTFILAFSGCASLVISGGINLLMASAGVGLFPGYYRLLKGMPQAPKWAIGVFSVTTLMVFMADALIISQDYFLAVAHLTVTFQAIKSFDLREPWDHLQVYFMSLLQLIITSELTYSLIYGGIFVFFLIAFVAAIVFAHFMKEGISLKTGIRKPVAFISLLTLMITAVFFVALPRLHGGLWGKGFAKSIRTVGFSEKVDFGSFGNVKLDPTVIMRIELRGQKDAEYYWRGMSLNSFDGISWKDTLNERRGIFRSGELFTLRPFQEQDAIVQRIFLEPMDTDVLFGLEEIAALEAEGRLFYADTAQSLFLPAKKGKRFQYTVYSVGKETPVKGDATLYLQLPGGVERVRALTREITVRRQGDGEKAAAIERYLKQNYTYALAAGKPPEGMSPLDDFLFNSRKGFCEHYATAMVIMLRTAGIPARIVTGFFGGEFNEYGGYMIVRQRNAHSWVEAAIDGHWRRFDPTPLVAETEGSVVTLFIDMLRMKWNRYVVGFSTIDQKEIMRTLSVPFRIPSLPGLRMRGIGVMVFSAAFIFLCVMGYLALKRYQFRRYGFGSDQYIRLKTILMKRGADLSPSATPSEVTRAAVRFGADKRISEFITLYEAHRFGGRTMNEQERVRYLQLFEEIGQQVKS